jgi:hypothetical protein
VTLENVLVGYRTGLALINQSMKQSRSVGKLVTRCCNAGYKEEREEIKGLWYPVCTQCGKKCFLQWIEEKV